MHDSRQRGGRTYSFSLWPSVACTVYREVGRVCRGADTIGRSTGIIAGVSGRDRFDS